MNKPALGKKIYNGCMIAVVVILGLLLFTFNITDKEITSFLRYMVFYFCFNGILSVGAIIREFLSLNYDKSKMYIKIIVNVIALIVGIVICVFFQYDVVGLVCFLLGLVITLYILTPTTKENNK